MRLATKHANQQNLISNQFNGGLNTVTAQEMIGENELSECLNMEIDSVTGLLKTVDGCQKVFSPPNDIKIKAAMYDSVNKIWLIVAADNNKIYTLDLTVETPALSADIGTLTGALFPVYTVWEDGILIASGGKLQYYTGKALTTLDTSPDKCTFVYIFAGRVIVACENEVKYSAVGDETGWTDESNIDSSSKFVEIGYKDGGKVLALIGMSQDLLIIKDNKRVYRLTGNYPNWSIHEVSRNIDCISRLGWYNAGETTFVLGKKEITVLDSSQFYGDIRATDIAKKITNLLNDISDNPRMIYVPPLNQVWLPMQRRYVLLLDLNTNSFFMRRFEAEDVTDIVSIGKDVYVARPNSISKIQKNTFTDNGEYMVWRFVGKRQISNNDFLIKRVGVNITPFFSNVVEGNIKVGGVVLPLPTPFVANRLWHNYAHVYHNRRHVCGANERFYNLYDAGKEVYENFERVWHNYTPVYNPAAIAMRTRSVFRGRTYAVSGTGRGGSFKINSVNYIVAEV